MDEREQFAMNIYLSEHPNRKQDDWEYQGSARIIYFQQADRLIAEGFSRRPELDEEELIPFLLTLRTFYNKDGDVDLTAISKAICAKFTAPEAKPASSVNAEVVKALNKISESTCMDCTSAMIAEQALNSIKAGKDAKCS